MIQLCDNFGRPVGTKDLSSIHISCPEENCKAFTKFWCVGGDVYYCDDCKAYRFFDKRFGTYFLMEKGDIASVYIDREDCFFKGSYVGKITAVYSGYIGFECSLKYINRIGFFEIRGISYPGVGLNRFYPGKL